jgi:hypothetical protein
VTLFGIIEKKRKEINLSILTPWNPKIVVVVQGSFFAKMIQLGSQNGGRYGQVVAMRRWSLVQVSPCLLP